jgi:hypothetical protein
LASRLLCVNNDLMILFTFHELCVGLDFETRASGLTRIKILINSSVMIVFSVTQFKS